MKLVIIDDCDLGCGPVLGNLLDHLGHIALMARDAEEALTLIDDSVDSVLIGLNQGCKNGMALARKVEVACDLPVAFFGWTDPEHSHKLVVSRQYGLVLPSVFSTADVDALLSRLPRRESILDRRSTSSSSTQELHGASRAA